MSLKYTTIEAVNRRLNGRLSIGGNATTMGATVVSPDLAGQIIEQIEARMDAALRKQYRLPLVGTHPTLAEIAEHGAVCQLLNQYQAGGQEGETIWSCQEFASLMETINDMPLPGETTLAESDGLAAQTQAGAFAGIANDAPTVVEW